MTTARGATVVVVNDGLHNISKRIDKGDFTLNFK